MDFIKRYVAEEGIRLSFAVTTDTVQEAATRHSLWPVASAALGRTMTGAILLAADFKNQENVSIRIDGGGPLGVIHVDAFAGNKLRGYVDHPQVDLPLNALGKLDVGGAVGIDGEIAVSRFLKGRQDYSSRAKLTSGEIAEDIAYYLYISEQVPSTISLGVLVDTDNSILAAGGFLVQALPEATEEALAQVEANISSIGTITNYLVQYKDGEGLVEKVLAGLHYKEVHEEPISFSCTCGKERFQQILMTLTDKDKADLLEDDQTELVCHYCNNHYHFSQEELKHLFTSNS